MLCPKLVTFPKAWSPEIIEFATLGIKRVVARVHRPVLSPRKDEHQSHFKEKEISEPSVLKYRTLHGHKTNFANSPFYRWENGGSDRSRQYT